MAQYKVTFNARRTFRGTQRAIDKAMKKVATEMATVIKRSIRLSYPPPSRPGAIPHIRTGTLKGSVKGTASRGTIKIRTVEYGKYLEGGTSKMAPRPFIHRQIAWKGKRAMWNRRIAKLVKQYTGGRARKR